MDQSAYQAMLAERDQLLQFRAQALKEREALEAERIAALAKAGQVEQALEETRKQWEAKYRDAEKLKSDIEASWLGEKKTTAIAEALNGKVFAGADPAKTAALVRRLLGEELEAARDSQGSPAVFDRATRRPAADYLKERLESPEFAIFFVANTRGGAGGDGTRAQANMDNNNDPTGDFMRQYRERMAALTGSTQGIYQG